MRGEPSPGDAPRSRAFVVALAVLFAAVNLVAMALYPTWVSVPFHLLWTGFAVWFGLFAGDDWDAWVALVLVGVVTGTLVTVDGLRTGVFPERAVEVPLMASMFAVLAWHIRRHSRLAREHRRLWLLTREMADRERRFVQRASHELRTPITVALGHADLLTRTTPDGPSRHDLEVIVDELVRLRHLTGQLLRFEAAVHAGPEDRDGTPVEPVLHHVVDRWAYASRSWRVSGPPGARVAIGRDRLEALLDALVDNALRHTGPGDELHLWCESGARETRIGLADAGTGIPADQLERVFDRFHRAGRGRDGSDGSGGFGLGLALVREVARLHGGDATAESDHGRTTITLSLPPGGSTSRGRSTSGREPRSSDPLRVPDRAGQSPVGPTPPPGVARGSAET